MKAGPLAAAVLIAAFLIVRRRKLEPTLLAGGAIVVLGLLVYSTGLVHLPNVQKILEDAGGVLGNWTYLVVAVMAFFETGAFVGLIAPGETFMIFGGVVAGQGEVNLIALIALVWASAIAGDLASFYLGRRLGRKFLVRHGPKVQITEERLHKVEAFFEQHGGKAILIGRFVGVVRAIAPFLAGSSGMPLRRFVPYDILGAGAWATTFLVLGYVFWQSFDKVLHVAEKGAFWLGAVIVVGVALVVAVRWLRVAEHRRELAEGVDRQLDRPLLRPLGRVLRPLWRRTSGPRRFVWNRVTPGDLGLEVTSLLAVAAVGSFVFAGYIIVLGDTALTAGDRRAHTLAIDLHTEFLVHVAKVVTSLGTLWAAGLGVLIAAGLLVRRRLVVEAVTLITGLVITYAGVHLTKPAMDRPRPEDSLVATDGSSYPSGHAAYAAVWIAIAVVLTRTSPGLARATAYVVAGVVVAVLVATTRVYLRAHYLSDVLGGLGLGTLVYAVCAVAALLVVHVRHNAERS